MNKFQVELVRYVERRERRWLWSTCAVFCVCIVAYTGLLATVGCILESDNPVIQAAVKKVLIVKPDWPEREKLTLFNMADWPERE